MINTKFHVTWKSTGLMLGLVSLLIPMEAVGAFFIFQILWPWFINQFPGVDFFIASGLGMLGIILLTMVISILVYRIGTYLKVSPDSLEYHRWPFTTISCGWSEVEKISQGNLMGLSFATLLIPRNKVGMEVHIGVGTLGSANYKGVPLNEFQGWPDGDLKKAIMPYAPKLFLPNHEK